MSTANSKSQAGTAPAEEAPEALVGQTIRGRYRVEALLGTGGMGTVYRVMHTGIDKRMALKVLSKRMMQNPSIVARFEREAKAAANFGHPHVAAATDYGRTDDGRFYLVMEYVEGKELREAMDEANGPMPPVRAFFIARQIASALSRAHKLGVVHRDLKPANIMLMRHDGQDDFVKVLDFGLALISRHLNSSEGEEQDAKTVPKITQVGEVFGTPSYMAPEQAVSAATDTRTDLYALGILLYEMLTGLRPFVGKNPVAIIQQQFVSPPPPMSDRWPGLKVPADIEALVMRLLAKQPEDRFQTPEDLIAAIDQIGVTHSFAWLGTVSAAHPALSGPSRPLPASHAGGLTLNLTTARTRLSGSLLRMRSKLFPKSTPRPGPGQESDAAAQQLDKANGKRSRLPLWLILSGVGLMIALLAGLLWHRGSPLAVPAPRPESGTSQPTMSPQTPAQQDAPEPVPARRSGTKRRQSH